MNCDSFEQKNTRNAEVHFPHRKKTYFLLIWLFFGLSSAAIAAPEKIEQALKQHIQQEINQYLEQLGAKRNQQKINLTLAPGLEKQECDDLIFSRPQANSAPVGRISYRIECTAPSSWQSRATARIQLWTNIVVASRTLQRNEKLSHDMLKTESVDLSTLNRDPIMTMDKILGMSVKRRIQQGNAISWSLLENPEIVKRGDIVTLLIRANGFSASAQGTAMENGIKGQQIKVKNSSSDKIVEGIVIESGVVETKLKFN